MYTFFCIIARNSSIELLSTNLKLLSSLIESSKASLKMTEQLYQIVSKNHKYLATCKTRLLPTCIEDIFLRYRFFLNSAVPRGILNYSPTMVSKLDFHVCTTYLVFNEIYILPLFLKIRVLKYIVQITILGFSVHTSITLTFIGMIFFFKFRQGLVAQ